MKGKMAIIKKLPMVQLVE